MVSDAVVTQTLYTHTCRRCASTYTSPRRAAGLCLDCRNWMKETQLTHCHRTECCRPENPTRFDRVKDTRYGKEYHCPKCGSWINFTLLAEVFSVGRKVD